MVATDEGSLICDFAEEYHIFNYRELPVLTCATLAVGLRDTSRIKAKLAGLDATLDVILLALISDNISTMLWFQTKDGQNGTNRPPSMLKLFTEREEKKNDVVGFDSAEDFKKARAKLLKGG